MPAANLVPISPKEIPRGFRKFMREPAQTRRNITPIADLTAYKRRVRILENIGGYSILFSVPFTILDAAAAAIFISGGSLTLIICGSIAAVIGTAAGSGFGIFGHTSKAENRLQDLTEQQVRTWLQTYWQIKPKPDTFNLAELTKLINVNDTFSLNFETETGETYALQRHATEKMLTVRKQTKVEKQPQSASAPAKKVAISTPLEPVDNLTPFGRLEQEKIRQAQHLIQTLGVNPDLTPEQVFTVNRADEIIGKTIQLARKLDSLPKLERKTAFGDLVTSINAALKDLRAVNSQLIAAHVKEARVLAIYSSNLHQGEDLKID